MSRPKKVKTKLKRTVGNFRVNPNLFRSDNIREHSKKHRIKIFHQNSLKSRVE